MVVSNKSRTFALAFQREALSNTVDVVQLVRASDCGSECRGFESHLPPLRAAREITVEAECSSRSAPLLFLCLFRRAAQGRAVLGLAMEGRPCLCRHFTAGAGHRGWCVGRAERLTGNPVALTVSLGRLTVVPVRAVAFSRSRTDEKGGCPVGGDSRLSSPAVGAY